MRFTKIRTLAEFVELFVDLRKGRGVRTHETNIRRNEKWQPVCVVDADEGVKWTLLTAFSGTTSCKPDTSYRFVVVFFIHFAFLNQ